MTHLLIEGGGYEVILYLILAIMFGPPLLFALIGRSYRNKNKKTAKVFYIIAVSYLLIGLGLCGAMMI